MLTLNKDSLANKKDWGATGVALPQFDIDKMRLQTKSEPIWVHIGSGNIFRGFIAALQHELLDIGKANTGIVAVEVYDEEIIQKIYKPHDDLSLLVLLNPDGTTDKRIIAGVGESLIGSPENKNDWERLKSIFTCPSLQMVSFTITEKGYSLKTLDGDYLPDVKYDLMKGPSSPRNTMSKALALAYERFKAGGCPIAFVSMDNCSNNGDILRNAMLDIATHWVENNLVEPSFFDYISNLEKVSFPWTMIDKITPRPSEIIRDDLEKTGVAGMDIICTDKKTYIAPFVNAETPQYLVIEDSFPNRRPTLELGGAIFTTRENVKNAERMKVTTCLNPLHTALAIFGCLLGYRLIADEMRDARLHKLVEKIGYNEGMPVVVDPIIIDPMEFIKEVIEKRLPNPFIPDTPQRIATDTSQKIPIRFGETLKFYLNHDELDIKSLRFIPLVLAGWCRYLMAVDDNGDEMPLSSDPMLEELQQNFITVKLGQPATAEGALKPILSSKKLFGLDLYEAGLGEQIEDYFKQMIAGKNAVNETLNKYLG
ncbi:MAG: mannitol dehydrogenase family protein [Oscillospiraceae bacterium]|nr:mannitol dehydrogenase family protein [Oscillospiraceae bacterium]